MENFAGLTCGKLISETCLCAEVGYAIDVASIEPFLEILGIEIRPLKAGISMLVYGTGTACKRRL